MDESGKNQAIPRLGPHHGLRLVYRMLATIAVPSRCLSSALLLIGLCIRQFELAVLGLSQTGTTLMDLPSSTALAVADWGESFLFGGCCCVAAVFSFSLLQSLSKIKCGQALVGALATLAGYSCQTLFLIPVHRLCLIQRENLAVTNMVSLAVVSIVALLVTYFVVELPFKRGSVFRKAHTSVDTMSVLMIMVQCWLDLLPLSPWFCTLLRLGSGGLMLQLFYHYQPYALTSMNLLESSGWLAFTVSSTSHLFELAFGSSNFSTFNIILPVFALASFYFLLKVRLESFRDREIASPYEFELKSRLLWEATPEQPGLMEFFRQHKKAYAYFTLFYLWEYDFYAHCLHQSSSALVQVYGLTLVTPDFMKKWLSIVRVRAEELFWDYHPTKVWLNQYTHDLNSEEVSKKIKGFLCIQEFEDSELSLLKHLIEALRRLGRTNTESQLNDHLLAVMMESKKLMHVAHKTKALTEESEELSNYYKVLFHALLGSQTRDASKVGRSKDSLSYWVLTGDHSRTVLYSNAGPMLGFQMPDLVGHPFASFLQKPFDRMLDLTLFNALMRGEELGPQLLLFLTHEGYIVKMIVEITPAVVDDTLYLIVKHSSLDKDCCVLLDNKDHVVNYSAILNPYFCQGDSFVEYSCLPRSDLSRLYRSSSSLQNFWCHTHLLPTGLHTLVDVASQSPHVRETHTFSNTNDSASAKLLQQVWALSTTDTSVAKQAVAKTAKALFRKSRRGLRALVVLGLFVSIGCLVGYSVYLYELTASSDLNEFISKAGLLRFFTIHCTDAVRTLNLISQGYSFTQSAEAYQAELDEYTTQFKTILDDIQGSYPEIYSILSTHEVFVHELYFNTIETKSTTLWEALWMLRNAAERYGGTIAEDSDFFFVYRNGPSELLRELDIAVRSLKELASQHYDEREAQLAFIGILVWLPSVVISLAVGCRYSRVEKANKLTWEVLSSSDCFSVQRTLRACTLVLREKYDRSVEEEEPERLVHLYKSTWLAIIACLASFVICSVAAYLFLTLTCHTNLVFALTNGAVYNEVSGLRRMLPRAAYFWTKEVALLEDKQNSYFNVLAPNTYYASPRLAAELAAFEFKNVNQYLLYEVEGAAATVNSRIAVFANHSVYPVGGLNAVVLDFVYQIASFLNQEALDWEDIRDYEPTASGVSADFVDVLASYNTAEKDTYFLLTAEVFGVVATLALLQICVVCFFLTKVLTRIDCTIKARLDLIKLLRR